MPRAKKDISGMPSPLGGKKAPTKLPKPKAPMGPVTMSPAKARRKVAKAVASASKLSNTKKRNKKGQFA